MSIFNLPKYAHPDFASPQRKAVGEVEIDWSHPLSNGLVSAIVTGLQSQDSGTDGVVLTKGGNQGFGVSTNPTISGWAFPDTKSVTSESAIHTTFVHWYQDNYYSAGANGRAIYTERPNGTQIYKIVYAKPASTAYVSFAVRDSAGGGLINLATQVNLDTANPRHSLMLVTAGATDRTLYVDDNVGTNATSSSGSYDASTPYVCVDPQDANASGPDINVNVVYTFKRALTAREYEYLRANPYSLLKPTYPLQAVLIESAAVAAITSVGGDDVVLDAEQNVSFVTSGFSGEISTVQLVSGTSITTINPASINSTGGSGDFDLIDISALTSPTVGAPLTTANNVVVARLTDS